MKTDRDEKLISSSRLAELVLNPSLAETPAEIRLVAQIKEIEEKGGIVEIPVD